MGRSSPSFSRSFSLEQPTSSGLVLRPHRAPEVGLCPDMAAGASAQTGCFSWSLPHGAQFRTGVAAGLTGEESRVGEAGHPPSLTQVCRWQTRPQRPSGLAPSRMEIEAGRDQCPQAAPRWSLSLGSPSRGSLPKVDYERRSWAQSPCHCPVPWSGSQPSWVQIFTRRVSVIKFLNLSHSICSSI